MSARQWRLHRRYCTVHSPDEQLMKTNVNASASGDKSTFLSHSTPPWRLHRCKPKGARRVLCALPVTAGSPAGTLPGLYREHDEALILIEIIYYARCRDNPAINKTLIIAFPDKHKSGRIIVSIALLTCLPSQDSFPLQVAASLGPLLRQPSYYPCV